ncbi:hypothetical protein, partial [Actinoplanes philippinensis]
LPYSPEPNLFIDGLLTLGRPDIRFGDAGAEFLMLSETLHQTYGEELTSAHGPEASSAVQVDSQNNRHPDRDQAFLTDFVGAATPTDLSRLAADFAATNFLPQSHAVPTTVNRQLFNTVGTGFKEYKADLRSPELSGGRPFAAPVDHTPGGDTRTWQRALSERQLKQLGAQPHNQLVTAISLPAPDAGPVPQPPADKETFTGVDPRVESTGQARTIGVPDSQRLVAAHLVATSNDSGTIQQQFATATTMADRGGLSLQPGSLYHAIAAAVPGTDADGNRAATLRAGRDRVNLDTAAEMRRTGPYDNAHFVRAALAPDVPATTRRTDPLDTAEIARIAAAHDVVELAAATGTKVQLTIHDDSGNPPRTHPVQGARPLGRLELRRTVDAHGHATYAPYTPPVAPAADSDSEDDGPGFGMFGDEDSDSDRGGLDVFGSFAPAGDTSTSDATTPAPTAEPVGSGLVLATPDDAATRSIAGVYPDRSDRYHVFAHGEQQALQVGTARISPAELAAQIRADGARWAGRPIVLIVCDSGIDRQNGFAAQLARELPGTPIIAPNGVVWAGPTGHAVVTASELRGPDGEPVTPPEQGHHFVRFEASATDPAQLTVTDLGHILDSNATLGDVDPGRMAQAIDQLAGWAQSDANRLAARVQPAVDTIAPALADVPAAASAQQTAGDLSRDAQADHAGLATNRLDLEQRASQAPKLAQAGVDAANRAGDSPDARHLRRIATEAQNRVRDENGPVRQSLSGAAREAATVRDFRDDAARAATTAARASEDLRYLRSSHDRLTTLAAEARDRADRAVQAAADADAALKLPPGPQRDLALADALLRAYPAVDGTSRRLSESRRVLSDLGMLGDLPTAVRDIRADAQDAADMVAELTFQQPRVRAAQAASVAHLDAARASLTASEQLITDVYDLADRLGVSPDPIGTDTDSDLEPPADLLTETTPDDSGSDWDLEPPADLLTETALDDSDWDLEPPADLLVETDDHGRLVPFAAAPEPPVPLRPKDPRESNEQFERRLGAHLSRSPQVRETAVKVAARLNEVLNAARAKPSPAGTPGKAFVQRKADSAGQAGTGLKDTEVTSLLRDGNLREVMTALYNAAYYNKKPGAGETTFKLLALDIIRNRDWERSDRLGLDTAELKAYADFLDNPLRQAVKQELPPEREFDGDDDPFRAFNLIARSGDRRKADLAVREQNESGRTARGSRDQVRGPYAVTPRQLRLAGTDLGAFEAAFLRSKAAGPFTVDTMSTEDVPLDQVVYGPDGRPDLSAVLGAKNTAAVTVEFGPEVDGRPSVSRVTREVFGTAKHPEPWKSWLGPDEQGPELPLPWVSGRAFYRLDPDSAWFQEVSGEREIPVTSGTSLTSARLLTMFRMLNVPGVTERDFLAAATGWMLAADNHSLYEVLRGAEIAGVQLTETPAAEITSAGRLYDEVREAGLDMPADDRPAPVEAVPAPAAVAGPGVVRTLVSGSSESAAAAATVTGPPGHFTVVSHDRFDDGRPVTARELADRIRTDPQYTGQPITLIICDSGVPGGLAQQLADLLPGTDVHAPDGPVWTTRGGEAFVSAVSAYGPDGRPKPPQLPPTGTWRTYRSPAETGIDGRRSGPYLSGADAGRSLTPDLHFAHRWASFQPVRVEGGRNTAFDALTRNSREVTPANYRQTTIELKNDGVPLSFVVNAMMPAADIHQIPAVIASITDGL